MAVAGGDGIGLDWRMPLDDGWAAVGFEHAVQGNLDPAVLLGTRELIRERAAAVLDAAGPTGHVFNLGHGILPETSPDHARFLVDTVRELSARRAS
jgi:uroporphyrinogen decarboxylase